MDLNLPNINTFKLDKYGSKFWWRDYYGAIEISASYCNVKR
jgi:hypothetical protein